LVLGSGTHDFLLETHGGVHSVAVREEEKGSVSNQDDKVGIACHRQVTAVSRYGKESKKRTHLFWRYSSKILRSFSTATVPCDVSKRDCVEVMIRDAGIREVAKRSDIMVEREVLGGRVFFVSSVLDVSDIQFCEVIVRP
jgi:hypothetical protein